MRMTSVLMRLLFAAAMIGIGGHQALTVRSAAAQDWARKLGLAREPVAALKRTPPVAPRDTSMERLAREIDWLEHHVDLYGTVTAKQPDVWGQARLTMFRDEYEAQMAQQLDNFDLRLNASLRRSDQAFLSMAFALQAASGSRGGQPLQPTTPADFQSVMQVVTGNSPAPADLVQRSAPFGLPQGVRPPFQFGQENEKFVIGLEPTIELDQRSRYLNYLHELRRINEGDDTADSPGYSLNVVRMPVSVLPGKATQTGYGAEITITAEPYLSDELLPMTFKRMVIADLVDQLALPLTNYLNRPDIKSEVEKFKFLCQCRLSFHGVEIHLSDHEARQLDDSLKNAAQDPILQTEAVQSFLNTDNRRAQFEAVGEAVPTFEELRPKVQQLLQFAGPEAAKNREELFKEFQGDISTPTVSIARSRNARHPFPPTQLLEIYGVEGLGLLTVTLYDAFQNDLVNKEVVHITDVQAFLREELEAAFDLLSTATPSPESIVLPPDVHGPHGVHPVYVEGADGARQPGFWSDHAGPELARAIRWRQTTLTDQKLIREEGARATSAVTKKREGYLLAAKAKAQAGGVRGDSEYLGTHDDLTAHLGWMILVESSLLNERLIHDVREAAANKGCQIPVADNTVFFGPRPPPDARFIFKEYVRCRWPIRVFALDPVTQDQNIADEFSRRRELQVALAMAFATGQINAQALSRFARRLEWDMATLALNRTAVGFAHGNDTFGWRFYPRFQTPPIKGQVRTFYELLAGGPTRDDELRDRQLEAGMRECVAIVIMPSFVPYVTLDVRSNWFAITNPKNTVMSMHDTMRLSRSIQSMRMASAECVQCAHLYRDGELDRMLRRVDQLDRELPLQTMRVQVPYENTLGGFEMFNTGTTDLAPELHGWYGTPGVDPNNQTTIYVVGDHFSVNMTAVLAGTRQIPRAVQRGQVGFRLLSRQIMEVTLPPDVDIIQQPFGQAPNQYGGFVDVHVATPYGVSNHLLVPVRNPVPKPADPPPALQWVPNRFEVSYKVDTTKTPQVVTVQRVAMDSNQLLIKSVGNTAPVDNAKLSVYLQTADVRLRDAGPFDLPFDGRTGDYYLIGDGLNKFVTGVNTQVVHYLTWLVNGPGNVPGEVSVSISARVLDGAGSANVENRLIAVFKRVE
jgi:hypothetical protein